jgi:hypothetical protein
MKNRIRHLIAEFNWYYAKGHLTDSQDIILKAPPHLMSIKNIEAIIYNINGVPGLCLDIPLNSGRPSYTVYFYKRPVPEAGDFTNIQARHVGFYDEIKIREAKLKAKMFCEVCKYDNDETEQTVKHILKEYRSFENKTPLKLALKNRDEKIIMHPEILSLLADIVAGKKKKTNDEESIVKMGLIYLTTEDTIFYDKSYAKNPKSTAFKVSHDLKKQGYEVSIHTINKYFQDFRKKFLKKRKIKNKKKQCFRLEKGKIYPL